MIHLNTVPKKGGESLFVLRDASETAELQFDKTTGNYTVHVLDKTDPENPNPGGGTTPGDGGTTPGGGITPGGGDNTTGGQIPGNGGSTAGGNGNGKNAPATGDESPLMVVLT